MMFCCIELSCSRSFDNCFTSLSADTPERIDPGNRIEHMPLGGSLETVEPFLPEGPIRVGITSGASTPDRVVEDVIQRMIALSEA
jgi:4-hydroxy-3-methylbut-2-enyl diphosphate reductase